MNIDIEQLLKVPAPVLLVLALNILAVVIRRTPLTNWLIPFIVLGLGTVVYPRITSAANTVFTQSETWTLYVQGFFLGGFSLGADSLLAKFDWYKRLTASMGDPYTQGKKQDAPASELQETPAPPKP